MTSEDFDSTLVRRGAQATTFTDMTEFVADIEHRPLEKLVADLPELARLSEVKFALARRTIQRRLSELPAEEREYIRELIESLATDSDSERIRSVFVQQGEA